MKISIKYFWGILLTIVSGKLWAQAPDLNVDIAKTEFQARQIIPPAPEAAELGKYGNTPVSLFTGTPQINIPIYELKGSYLSLPVSLSYNASGFKPEDLPTWVGLNWSLNAGGVITRAVKGNPDNDQNYFGSNDNLVFPPSQDLFAYYDFMHDAKIARRELEPDYYYYNFGNYTGKFLLQPDKNILKKERDNLKIEQCITCNPSSMTITDEQGNKYEFTEVETTRMTLDDEATDDAPIYTTYIYPSSWYLGKITSADGSEQMLFEYYSTAEHYLSKNFLANKSVTYTFSVIETTPVTITSETSAYTSTPPNVYVKRKFLKRITLQRNNQVVSYIDFGSATGRLDAEMSDDRYLQNIKVYSRTNNADKLVKEFDFGYGYFSNVVNTFKKYRLRLDNLQEIPTITGTSAKPPYQFEYNTDGTMPEQYTTKLDHWGFYNASSNTSLVPRVNLNPSESYGDGADREPNLRGASYGILQKIKYPTGGYSIFQYELNNAKNDDGTIRNIGGLRIKSITDYSFLDRKATVKRYEYLLEDGTTSGQSDPSFPKYLVENTYRRYAVLPDNDPSLREMRAHKVTVSANSIYGLGAIQGSHIGYSRVVEYQDDITNGMPLGKTVYNYHVAYYLPYDRDISDGDLEKKSVYDGNGKLLQETTNTYNTNIIGTIMGAKIKMQASQDNKYVICKRVDANGVASYERYTDFVTISGCVQTKNYYNLLRAENYTIYLQEKFLIKQTEKKYDQQSNSYLLNTRINTYGSSQHTYPTQIEDYTTGDEEVVTKKKYAADYILPSGELLDNIAAGISYLQGKNILGAEVESYQYRQNQNGTNRRYLNGALTVYGPSNPYPSNIYRLETVAPLTFNESTVNTSGVFTKDSHYQPLAYFNYTGSNIIEQGKVNDAPKAYIWGYSNNYPIAEVNNSSVKNIAYTSFETNETGGWLTSNITINTTTAFTGKQSCSMGASGIISKLPVVAYNAPMIVSYWAKSGALTVKLGSNVIPAATGTTANGWTFYTHTLPNGASQISITGANNIVDELRLHPKEAQMTTYTYDPGIGITNMVSPSNQVLSYEYDGLNRVVNIRDEKGNIKQNFVYNYGSGTNTMETPPQTLFYNSKKEQAFTKNDCTAGAPASVTYAVNYGKYVSAISQADADNKAQEEINANGQSYANSHGQCLFYNDEKSMRFVRTNCTADQGLGLFYVYTVPANKYSSPVSKDDANRLAQEDIDANGQAAANLYGRCACGDEGMKSINGQCETGTRINDASYSLPDGTYRCEYHYEFSDGTASQEYISYGSSPCPVI